MPEPMKDNQDALVNIACQTALHAAQAFLRKVGRHDAITIEVMRPILKQKVCAALDTAIKEFKEAHEAGMDNVGTATFLTTMSLAGIAAAKEATR